MLCISVVNFSHCFLLFGLMVGSLVKFSWGTCLSYLCEVSLALLTENARARSIVIAVGQCIELRVLLGLAVWYSSRVAHWVMTLLSSCSSVDEARM